MGGGAAEGNTMKPVCVRSMAMVAVIVAAHSNRHTAPGARRPTRPRARAGRRGTRRRRSADRAALALQQACLCPQTGHRST